MRLYCQFRILENVNQVPQQLLSSGQQVNLPVITTDNNKRFGIRKEKISNKFKSWSSVSFFLRHMHRPTIQKGENLQTHFSTSRKKDVKMQQVHRKRKNWMAMPACSPNYVLIGRIWSGGCKTVKSNQVRRMVTFRQLELFSTHLYVRWWEKSGVCISHPKSCRLSCL